MGPAHLSSQQLCLGGGSPGVSQHLPQEQIGQGRDRCWREAGLPLPAPWVVKGASFPNGRSGPYLAFCCLFQNMAEKFLDGELPLDSFIDVYQNKRKLAHMRRVKIEKLQEMVLKGQRLPQAPAPAPLPPRVPEPVPAVPLPYPTPEASGPPSVMPRRIPPPPPPVPAGRLATPFTAAVGSGQAFPYPASQCPPLPPRVGLPPQQGFSQFVSPYPPALPQRPPPRLPPHQPGFILQ